jgi:insertion element IS1 protein InsB
LELDELWSFVLEKARKRWVWLALCRATRQVVVAYYAIGNRRGEATRRRLGERIPEAYRGVDVATAISGKRIGRSPRPSSTWRGRQRRSGETAHVERWNNTLRQRLGRFVGKSLSFSKSEEMHEVCLRLFLHRATTSRLSPTIEPLPDALMKLEEDDKILAGGLPIGDRAFVFIAEAASNEELDRMLRSIPAWGVLNWEVNALQTFAGRAAQEREIVEEFKRTL